MVGARQRRRPAAGGRWAGLLVRVDAFGLPAENAAIKNRINPRDWTMSNIANMRRQLRQMGATFDWSAEVVTCDPDYYRWNQWFFLQFLKAGLAYRAKSAVIGVRTTGRSLVSRSKAPTATAGAAGEGREARPGPVVSARHQVRRRAARLQRDPVPRAGPDPTDELDRAVRGRRDRVRNGAVRPSRGRR